MSTPVFQERVLNAVDVCSNCFGLARVERDRPAHPPKSKNPNTGEWMEIAPARWSRNNQRTTREYVPADRPTDAKNIFCSCGVSGSYTRARDEIVSSERFRELLKQAIQTVEQKGVSLSREHAVRRALKLGCPSEAQFPAYSADEAIGRGIEYGVEMATVQSQSRSRASTRAVPAD